MDPKEFAAGVKVETEEHTDGNKRIGAKITLDHYAETHDWKRRDYYKGLDRFEENMKDGAKF
jgi:hypothetical protein